MSRTSWMAGVLSFLVPFAAFAQAAALQATVLELRGKVEVRRPGEAWLPAQANMGVPQGAAISTGFSSRAVLGIGQTRITVWPLTRMIIRVLVKRNVTNVSSLGLRIGKLNTIVKAAPGEKSDFRIRGPVSTAAVRGTEFTYDSSIDDRVDVLRDTVTLSNEIGQAITLFQGESAATDGASFLSPEVLKAERSFVVLPFGDLLASALSDQGGSVLSPPPGEGASTNVLPSGSVTSVAVTVTVN